MDIIEKAVHILRTDGIVIYPTETVYGLGGDAFSDDAIMRVYEAKQRPLSKPMSIAVSDLDMLSAVAYTGKREMEFIERFLPGPVTVILRARSCLPPVLTGGTGMIGIRYPAHPVAIDLISRLDSPITATSANLSGARDPVTPGECHVPHDLLIDGGLLPGTPSAVVDLMEGRVLREGVLSKEICSFFKSR